MKKLLLALAIATMSISAYAENVTFDGDTGIVHIPIVDFQGAPAYSDVELKLRDDGLFELVKLTEYPQNNIPDSDDRVYPYDDNFEFYKQPIGTILNLSDGSLWKITGSSNYTNYVTGNRGLTIYRSSDSVPKPSEGRSSDYFMLIEGNSGTYFVEELPMLEVIVNDNFEFYKQPIGTILNLSDGSLWKITGSSNYTNYVTGNRGLTIYRSSDSINSPSSGQRTNYFMLIEGNSGTYFVTPL